MITINKEILSEILSHYRFSNEITNYMFLINGQELEQENSRIKIIIRVFLKNNKSLIVKIVKEHEHPIEIIEQQSVLSECFLVNNIVVPRRYLNLSNTYCFIKYIYGYECCITVEDDLGYNELEIINKNYVKELAIIMANMHTISEKNKCVIMTNTIWDIYDINSDIMQGFKSFLSFEKKYSFDRVNHPKYREIINCYYRKKEKLSENWSKLPKYAVQGDFSTNNMILNENGTIKGVIDFNIAGNEVLVNDMITQGIFVCYVMDLEKGLSDDHRKDLYDLFIQTYMNTRQLNDLELSVINDIYNVVYPFLWLRIDNLESYFESGKFENVNSFLDDTWEILNNRYFK